MISVLIATKNRPEPLLACLQAIVANRFAQYEVVVIEQSKLVAPVVQQYVNTQHLIRLFHLPGKGKSRALNFGLNKVRGDLIAFTDDDCLVSRNWLATIERSFATTHTDAMFGQVLSNQPAKHPGAICPCTIRFKKKELVRRPRYHVTIGYGNNMVFRRQALEELGPPKLWLGPGSAGASADDAELVLRALLMGKTVLREPKLVVYHDRWLAPSAMKRQALIYTRGEAACYGYLAFQGHVFAWRVLKNGLLAKRHDFSQLLAYAKGLLAAGYFYLFDG